MAKMIILGDSIIQSFVAYRGGQTVVADPTIGQTIAKETGLEVTDKAVAGTEVVYGSNSLIDEVKRYNFAYYDVVMLGYGTNDYLHQHESLQQVLDGYQQALDKIKADNPAIAIVAVLPIQSFELANGDMDALNTMGFSQNMLNDNLAELVRKNGGNVIDWREQPIVTDFNHQETLRDGTLHPNQATYNLMAEQIVERMNKMSLGLTKIFTDMNGGPEAIQKNFEVVEQAVTAVADNPNVSVTIGEWQNNITGINGFNASDMQSQKITIIDNKTGHKLVILMIDGRLQSPGIHKQAKVDAFSVPYHFDHGVLSTAYPIMGGDELVRAQIVASTGSTTNINLDNTTQYELDAGTLWMPCHIIWTE